jgi:hypothetical protein
MPCDFAALKAQERLAREAAKKELDSLLAKRAVRLAIDPVTRKVTIEGYRATPAAKSGWKDACILAAVGRSGSYAAKAHLTSELQRLRVGGGLQGLIAAHRHGH